MTLIVLTGGTSRLVHVSPTGGVIFRLLPDGAAKSIRVIAASRVLSLPPDVGDVLTISGHYANDRKYGIQFVARTVLRALPRGKDIVKLFTSHPTFAWIDASLARSLWRALGIELIATLQAQDYAALSSAAPISPSDAMRLVGDWRDYTRSISVSECFAQHGLPLACVPKAIKLWGNDTAAHVVANPYSLVPIASWGQIDDVCTASLGLTEDDDRRLIAACVSCAEEYVSRNRSMRMPVRLLTERITARLGPSLRAATAIQLAHSHGRISIDGTGNGASAQPIGARLLEAAFIHRLNALLVAELPMRNTGLSELGVMRPKSVASGLHAHPAFNLVDIECYCALRSSLHAGHRAVHIFPSMSMRDCIIGATHNSQLISEILRSNHCKPSLDFIVYGCDALDLATATKLLYALPTLCNLTVVYPGEILCGPDSFWQFLTKSNVASTRTFASWRRLRCESILPLPSSAGASNNLCSAGTLHPSEPILPDFSKSPQVHRVDLKSSSAALARALAAYREAVDSDTALLLTIYKRDASRLNQILHEEHVELRRAMRLPLPAIQIYGGMEATLGERIVARMDIHDKYLFAGSLGVITDIAPLPHVENLSIAGADVIVATALFDTVGLVQLTTSDCGVIDLGYALPLGLDRWGVVAHRIILLQKASDDFELNRSHVSRTRKTIQIIKEISTATSKTPSSNTPATEGPAC